MDFLRLFAWNPHFCCVPLHEISTFDEFESIFSIGFLARVMSMLQVLIQYPTEYHSFMKDIKPISGNTCLTSLFSSVFISPDIVVANMALLRSDLTYLQENLSLKEQKFYLCLLSALAPTHEARLPNFGRSQERDELLDRKSTNRSGQENDDDDDDAPSTYTKKGSKKASIFIQTSISKVNIKFILLE